MTRDAENADCSPADVRADAVTIHAVPTDVAVRDALNHLDQGISIVDRNLRLEFVNRRFCELLDIPVVLTRPGTPCADIFRFNAERGE